MKTITQLKDIIAERKRWSLADENRDAKLFLDILDELADHIDRLEKEPHSIPEYLPTR